MALTMYMSITGTNQGYIKGGCTQAGDKNEKILVYGYEQKSSIPINPHDGLPTGQRRHGSLCIETAKDVSSPKLFQALCSGEQLSEVTLDFYHITPIGKEKCYYKIALKRAIIVDIFAYTPLTFLGDNTPYMDMERIEFTFSEIVVTYTDGNIEAVDSWEGGSGSA